MNVDGYRGAQIDVMPTAENGMIWAHQLVFLPKLYKSGLKVVSQTMAAKQ